MDLPRELPPSRSTTPEINCPRKEINDDADDRKNDEGESSDCCGNQKNECGGENDHVIEEGKPQSIQRTHLDG